MVQGLKENFKNIGTNQSITSDNQIKIDANDIDNNLLPNVNIMNNQESLFHNIEEKVNNNINVKVCESIPIQVFLKYSCHREVERTIFTSELSNPSGGVNQILEVK